jgi:hypothetical protein
LDTIDALFDAGPVLKVAKGGTGISSFGTGVATFLGTPSSANLAAAVTGETGSGALVFANTPTLIAPLLGTPTSGNFSTGTFTWPTFNQNTTGTAAGLSATLATTSGGTGLSSFTSGGVVYASSSSALATGSNLYFDGTNLGVGNASPQALLHVGSVVEAPGFGTTSQMSYVNGTSQPEVLVRQTTNDVVVSMYADSTGGAIRTATNHPLSFITNNSEKMRLDTSGNLGIGTSSPSQKLQVNGTGRFYKASASTIGAVASSGLLIDGAGTNGELSQIGFGYDSALTYMPAAIYGITTTQSGNTAMAIGFATRNVTTDTAPTERLRLDSAGNLGLGVTPTAGVGDTKHIEISGGGAFRSQNVNVDLGANYYYDSAYKYIVTGAASRFEQNSGAYKWYSAASGTAGDAISFTQAMTLTAAGTLLLGTTTSLTGAASGRTDFSINGSSNAIISFGIGGTRQGYLYAPSTGIILASETGILSLQTTSTEPIQFITNNTERARIDSSGNLLVGTTSTGAYFDSRANFYSPSVYAAFGGKQGGTAPTPVAIFWQTATTGDNVFAIFGTEASFTERGSISYNRTGGLTVYNTTSDYRAKDISGPVTNSGALIDSIPVYMGKMKWATEERPMFIAHETPSYAHTGVKDAVDADGNPVYQQMDASALIPVMWAEIQSLRQRLSAANL